MFKLALQQSCTNFQTLLCEIIFQILYLLIYVPVRALHIKHINVAYSVLSSVNVFVLMINK